jgi:hypothetical protein
MLNKIFRLSVRKRVGKDLTPDGLCIVLSGLMSLLYIFL